MEQDYLDELIAKTLAGEASSEEKDLLNRWRKESLQNQSYYEDAKLIFDRVDLLKEELPVNTEAAWKKLEARIDQEEARVLPLFTRKRFFQAAASIFLLVTLSFVLNWFFSNSDKNQIELLSHGESIQHQLPDGSTIILESNSQLSYSETNKHERRVKLKGSAHFKVVHDATNNFVIEVQDVLIKDIGTSFYVQENTMSHLVEVGVEEGEVQFYSEHNEGLRLIKNEKANYNTITKEFIRLMPEVNDHTIEHLSRIFHFDNSSLEEVVDELNRVYKANIRLDDPKMANCRLSVNFKNEELDVLLSVIAETLDLKISKQDSSIILRGKPCSE